MVLGRVNRSTSEFKPTPMPTGKEMEDSFESIALDSNSLFRGFLEIRARGRVARGLGAGAG